MPIAGRGGPRRLEQVGCRRSSAARDALDGLSSPPTWRPDLTDPADLVEEVVRLEGYDRCRRCCRRRRPGAG